MQNLHGMQPVGAELERIVARSVRKAAPGEGPLLAWPLVCGSTVAERTRALDFAGGVLRVEVGDRGWQVELQALAPRYVAVINKYVAENVARVEFVVTARK
jgi:hypothetical protein